MLQNVSPANNGWAVLLTQAVMAKIKTYRRLMATFATNAKNELALLNTIQVSEVFPVFLQLAQSVHVTQL